MTELSCIQSAHCLKEFAEFIIARPHLHLNGHEEIMPALQWWAFTLRSSRTRQCAQRSGNDMEMLGRLLDQPCCGWSGSRDSWMSRPDMSITILMYYFWDFWDLVAREDGCTFFYRRFGRDLWYIVFLTLQKLRLFDAWLVLHLHVWTFVILMFAQMDYRHLGSLDCVHYSSIFWTVTYALNIVRPKTRVEARHHTDRRTGHLGRSLKAEVYRNRSRQLVNCLGMD